MRKLFNITGVFSLLIFSFYYAFKINDVLVMQSELMNEIKTKEKQYIVDPIDAQIKDDYIIPGKSGLVVNVVESYYSMKVFSEFNESFLIYEEVLPSVSISNNLDKYIISGNKSNRKISMIVNNNDYILQYLENSNIKINKVINYNEYNKNEFHEQLNGDVSEFAKLNNILENKICVVNDNNLEICKKFEYFLVKPKIIINSQNFLDVKNHLESGQIFIISDTLSLDNFKILYNELIFKGYELCTLSEMIKE